MSKRYSYWDESVAIALEDAGVTVTEKQLEIIVGSIEVSHDNYGMSHGYDCIPNPLVEENTRLKDALKREQDKRVCSNCKGKGAIFESYLNRSSSFRCDKCRGEGYC